MEHDTRVRVTKSEPPKGDEYVLAWMRRWWAPARPQAVAERPDVYPSWIPMPPPPAVTE